MKQKLVFSKIFFTVTIAQHLPILIFPTYTKENDEEEKKTEHIKKFNSIQ